MKSTSHYKPLPILFNTEGTVPADPNSHKPVSASKFRAEFELMLKERKRDPAAQIVDPDQPPLSDIEILMLASGGETRGNLWVMLFRRAKDVDPTLHVLNRTLRSRIYLLPDTEPFQQQDLDFIRSVMHDPMRTALELVLADTSTNPERKAMERLSVANVANKSSCDELSRASPIYNSKNLPKAY